MVTLCVATGLGLASGQDSLSITTQAQILSPGEDSYVSGSTLLPACSRHTCADRQPPK
jgi:hypothetical protein